MNFSAAIRHLSGVALFLAAAACLTASAASADSVCTVLADAGTGEVLVEQGVCDERVPPASTFKIAISLMGYDAGFLKDEHSPELPFKEDYPDWRESWRADTDPTVWMRDSVVWYSQQVTLSLGMQRFADYAAAFGYGNADVSGDAGKDNGLTRAWLSSSLRISPLEQVRFLTRMVNGKLPVSDHAHAMTEAIMTATGLPNGWMARGKTGAGASVASDGKLHRDQPIGWFVGWAAKGGRNIVFVRMTQYSTRPKLSPGFDTRDRLLADLPALLEAL